jgi:hypothetical protein
MSESIDSGTARRLEQETLEILREQLSEALVDTNLDPFDCGGFPAGLADPENVRD